MAKIETSYQCYACDYQHTNVEIKKPKLLEPTVCRQRCYACESEFIMIFKHAGIKKLQYGFLTNSIILGEKGKQKLEEKAKLLLEKQKKASANSGQKQKQEGV